MREIKFRFWSNHLGKFVVPDDRIFVGALKDPDMNPMQFTGLKDKNGKEIYEGDILRAKKNAWGYIELLMKCWWDEENACFKFKVLDKNGDSKGFASINDDYAARVVADWGEVIGNIYENRELL